MNEKQQRTTANELRKINYYRLKHYGSPYCDETELLGEWLNQHPRLHANMVRSGVDWCFPEFLAIARSVLNDVNPLTNPSATFSGE